MKLNKIKEDLGIDFNTDLEIFQELLNNPKTSSKVKKMMEQIQKEKKEKEDLRKIDLYNQGKITNEEMYLKYREKKKKAQGLKNKLKRISYLNADKLNRESWRKFFSYYRTHIDEFCVEVLEIGLYDFQRVILRCMAEYKETIFIASRGIGKSYLSAVFFIATAILYPSIKLGIASGKGQQARNVIIQKIKGELANNPIILNEIEGGIKGIATGATNCVVRFKNNSEIRAIVLGVKGDNARSWRFQYLLIDEARLVKDSIIEEILVPMTKTEREKVIDLRRKLKKEKKNLDVEDGKIIYITSAYLKTCDMYTRFVEAYKNMMLKKDKQSFVCCIPYTVGVEAGIFSQKNIDSEKNKKTMTEDIFNYEYNALFVGASAGSHYPYELTDTARVLEKVETREVEEKGDGVEDYFYVITHDVATSTKVRADNNATSIIKCIDRGVPKFEKRVVYLRASKGERVSKQVNRVRDLYHRFPSTRKIVVDIAGSGQTAPEYFAKPYVPTNCSVNNMQKPIVLDNLEEYEGNRSVNPVLRGVHADKKFNNSFYIYYRDCFEEGTLLLPVPSIEKIDEYKMRDMSGDDVQSITDEEMDVYVNTDILIKELSNIKKIVGENNEIEFKRISEGNSDGAKRDRVTSIGYGLSYIQELERQRLGEDLEYEDDEDDEDVMIA